MIKKFTLLLLFLLCMVGGASATPSETVLEMNGGWSYSRSGRATVSFEKWGHFNIANVGDIDVANYKSITMTYSNLSGRFKIATIGTVSGDENTSIEVSDEINSTSATSGSITITFDTSNYTANTYKSTNTIISSVDLINQDEADASITIESVILTDKSSNEYNMGYGVRWSCSPSYFESKYTFQSWGQVGHDNWKTDYSASTIHRFTINFADPVPANFKFRIYTPDGEDEGDADDESYQDISEGATSATVEINYNYKNIDLVNTGSTFQTVNITSVTRTIVTVSEAELWNNTQDFGEWYNFEDLRTGKKADLANAKIGDIIRLTCTNANAGNNVNVCNGYTYETMEGFGKTAVVQDDEQIIDFELTSAENVERIKESGIVISGKFFTLKKVVLISNDESIELNFSPITITDGVATYNSSYALDFTGSELKAYIATGYSVENKTVTMKRVYKVPANTGLYLVGENHGYEIPYYEGDTDDTSGNLLHATNLWKSKVYESMSGEYRYILAKPKSGGDPGFYKVTATGLSNTESEEGTYKGKKYHTLAAHKAYLQTTDDLAPGVSLSRGLTLEFGDGTTAIWNVKEDKVDTGNVREDGVYYTLQGTRVQNPSKGLYILNGKKVFIK